MTFPIVFEQLDQLHAKSLGNIKKKTKTLSIQCLTT